MVLAPTPAHVKSSSRRAAAQDGTRGTAREHASVQPLAPASRRQSQQHISRAERESQALASHPYAATPSPGGYRATAYDRSSPNGGTPATNGQANGNDSFVYGQQQGKNGTNSREGTTTAGTAANRDTMGGTGTRGVGMYDREQMTRVGEQDEHGGRHRGFWAAFCCRG